ncbi:MAG TPA: hypothetical protein VGN79_12475 [Devosia sp.]|jgi:hypothetical protein|nr:hypothetical protein [Devosia sp.]
MWVRIRERVPLRAPEWLAGLVTILIGLYFVAFPTAFERAGLSGFESIASVGMWVAAGLLLGAARIGALVLNGHQPTISAPVRCLVAICGIGLFGSIAAGYSLSWNQHGPPLGMVLALGFTAADIFNTARSALDVLKAFRRARSWNGSLR